MNNYKSIKIQKLHVFGISEKKTKARVLHLEGCSGGDLLRIQMQRLRIEKYKVNNGLFWPENWRKT